MSVAEESLTEFERQVMIRFSTIKVRIYPTPTQQETIDQTFHCCRFMWNQLLEDQDEFYAATDKHFIPSPGKYKNDFPFLKEADSQALVVVRQNLQKAFQNYFDNPRKFHHPTFKKKKAPKFTYATYCHHYHGRVPDSIRIQNDGIVLPKVKWVRAKLHRLPQADWILQYAVVSKTKTGKYFCSLVYKYEVVSKPQTTPEEGKTVGLKYSYTHFYVDSDGKMADPPQWMKLNQEKLKAIQRKLSRMQKGSKNYQETVQKYRLLHEHIANQRLDYIHKESRRIANAWDAVCVRSDDYQSLAQTVGYANILDSTFAKFRSCLDYKLDWEGKRMIAVWPEKPTTKLCHVCGAVNENVPRGKVFWTCLHCGTRLCREINAAINIKKQGMAQISVSG